MKENKFNQFTEDQLSKLNEIAREIRPYVLDDKKLIYSHSSMDVAFVFDASYRFIQLIRTKNMDNDINILLDRMLLKLEHIFININNLIFEYNSNNSLNKFRISYVMQYQILNIYRELMLEITEFAYPLGKKINLFDPDIHGGIIEND